MNEQRGEEEGGWGMIPRLAGGAVSVPLVMGFVALGAVVLVGRSLRDVVRVSLSRRLRRNGHSQRPPGSRSDAA
jgi:hypothetical protein